MLAVIKGCSKDRLPAGATRKLPGRSHTFCPHHFLGILAFSRLLASTKPTDLLVRSGAIRKWLSFMEKGTCHPSDTSIVLIVDNQLCTFSLEILGRIALDTLKYVDTRENEE